ncbi:hypothetical protein ACHAWF_005707 [Thalassiosira exigua]
MAYEARHLAQALCASKAMIGKEGPCYFDCGVIAHNCFLPYEMEETLDRAGVTDRFVIGKKSHPVTMEDIIDALDAASKNELLHKVQFDYGRSYYHEGYCMSKDGKTLRMKWGS